MELCVCEVTGECRRPIERAGVYCVKRLLQARHHMGHLKIVNWMDPSSKYENCASTQAVQFWFWFWLGSD